MGRVVGGSTLVKAMGETARMVQVDVLGGNEEDWMMREEEADDSTNVQRLLELGLSRQLPPTEGGASRASLSRTESMVDFPLDADGNPLVSPSAVDYGSPALYCFGEREPSLGLTTGEILEGGERTEEHAAITHVTAPTYSKGGSGNGGPAHANGNGHGGNHGGKGSNGNGSKPRGNADADAPTENGSSSSSSDSIRSSPHGGHSPGSHSSGGNFDEATISRGLAKPGREMPADFGGVQIAVDAIADPRKETTLRDWQVVSEAILDTPVPSMIEDEYALLEGAPAPDVVAAPPAAAPASSVAATAATAAAAAAAAHATGDTSALARETSEESTGLF